MAHPFYATSALPKSDPSWGKLQDYITQAARLASNERVVNKQQAGAKERLAMELDSVEARFNRSENRLDAALRNTMADSASNRQRMDQIMKHAEALHPFEQEQMKLENEKNRRTMEHNVNLAKYDALNASFEHYQNEANAIINTEIGNVMGQNQFKDVFQTDMDGNFIRENGKIQLKDGAVEALRNRNDDNLSRIWQEDILSNERYQELSDKGALSYNDFVSAYKEAENTKNAQFDLQLSNAMMGITDEDGEPISPKDTMDYLHEQFAQDEPEFYKQVMAIIANNPESKYYDESMGKGSSDWTSTEFMSSPDGMKAMDIFEDAVKMNENLDSHSGGLKMQDMDYASLWSTFKDKNMTTDAIKELARSIGETNSELDMAKFGAKTINGRKYFTFYEDDAGSGYADDYWIGRMSEDGKIYWQEPQMRTDWNDARWVDDYAWGTYETDEMLKHTEDETGSQADVSNINWRNPK